MYNLSPVTADFAWLTRVWWEVPVLTFVVPRGYGLSHVQRLKVGGAVYHVEVLTDGVTVTAEEQRTDEEPVWLTLFQTYEHRCLCCRLAAWCPADVVILSARSRVFVAWLSFRRLPRRRYSAAESWSELRNHTGPRPLPEILLFGQLVVLSSRPTSPNQTEKENVSAFP